MSDVLLIQLDGKIPNLALMRIAAHHKALGDTVELSRSVYVGSRFDRIYASAVFQKTRPKIDLLKRYRPDAIVGGTAVDNNNKLSDVGIFTDKTDYSLYPEFPYSLGYTQRGCTLSCGFCGVPEKEGKPSFAATIGDIWRGEPWPRGVVLLDNDFFGIPQWRERIKELREGQFKVSFNQGVNIRLMGDEECEAICSVDYRDGDLKTKRFYTAWDNGKQEELVFKTLHNLVRYGMKPDHIMVYMLIGYWPNETADDRDYRRKKLRDFGARPYPMPYIRSKELVGFQRWVIGAYDKRFTWKQWEAANYRPENLGFAVETA